MSLSATLFGRDSAIFKATNILGLGIPGWLDRKFGAPETEGPRLSDLSVQSSTYGTAMPRLYGTIAVAGNLTWLENNKLKETVTKNESGGKGGSSSSEPTTTFSYSATFHLSLCQGPIAGVKRIWCGDKLIYNAGSSDIETIVASNNRADGFQIYYGTDDQEPEPRYEADKGVGNVSAHRGEAYIAFYDFELEDYGNTLQGAQFKVEVVTEGWDTVLPIDETPPISDDFSWLRVFGEIGGLYGVRLMDHSTTADSTGLDASFNIRNFRLGSLPPSGEEILISDLDIDGSAFPSAARSSDGRIWYQYRSTDTFITGRPHLRCDSEDLGGSFIQMPTAVSYAQDIIQSSTDNGPFFKEFIFLFSYNVTPDREAIDKVGYAQVLNSGAIYNVTLSRSQASGWNISTAGDAAYEWRITGASASSVKTFHVRIYNETLSAVTDSFTGELPAGWPIMISGSRQEQKVVCRVRNGTAYIIGKDRIDDGKYRVAVINASGTRTEYEFESPNAAGEDLCAIWPFDSNQGIAQTENRIIQWRRFASGGVPLAQVIQSETALSGLIDDSDIDTSLINKTVRGYRVTGGTIRSSIEPLQAAFPFDVRQHGYQIQFLPRGQSSVATISWEELVPPGDTASGEILQESREMDSQLSARTTIKYLDASREYAISEQYSERLNTEAVNRSERELPLVMSASEAAQSAEILNFLPWLERTGYAFSFPPSYRYLEPGDVITLQMPNATYQLRLTDTNETTSGRIECKAASNRAALYGSSATGSEGVPPTGNVPLAGESFFLPLDIPVVDETIQNAVGFVGVMTGFTSGWPGGMAVRSNDNGQTWTRLQGYTGKATIGVTRSALSASNGTMIDQSSILIDLVSGTLESKTKDQMLSGVNYAAYGVNGRWEIVRFQNASLQSDGSYLVSGFVRGDRGTEWATGIHAANDYFVLLDDPDNAFIGSPVESLGLERLYRGVTLRESVDTAVDVPFTYNGVNLECLSPVYASGSRDGSSNFTGAFTRRSRLSSSWWTTGVVSPVGEVSESYEIDVMNGSAVERTISVTSPSFAYSAADQTTDFGSPQSSITFRIYQLSGTVGRGFPYEVTL